MKFSTTTLATILLALAAVDTSNASVRGATSTQHRDDKAAWSTTHFGTTHTHRHLEQGNADCLMVQRDTQFEDRLEREGRSHVWVCEFPFAVSQSKLNGRIFIDIDVTDENGLTKTTIDSMNVTSGASILQTTGAYIEEVLDTGAMTMHIPNTATMEVISIDGEHDSQHKRRLASPNPGTLSVLVIKVIDSAGAQISATNAQLVNDIFTDQYSLKTGYESCSNDQLLIEPAANRNDGENGVVDGITTVVLDIEAEDDNEADLRDAAVDKATEEYGDVSSQYDLVMLCLPRTSDFLAYAYINSWLSVYNDYWCQRVSAQMHEIGHNLGFAHSNQDGQSYKDQSGMMGYSYNQDDGPKMCFNAPKNFQTGWYTNSQESFYPLENKNSMVERTLIGITDYQVSGNNNGNLVTLRLGDDENDASNSNGDDYYVGFNLKDGINEGTLEGADQVIVFRKQAGGPTQYGESDRIADLNAGDSYTIQGFKGTSFDVTIRVKPFGNNDRTAPIEITTGVVGPQTPAPVPSPTNTPTKSPTNVPTKSPTSAPTTNAPTNTPDPSFENLGTGYCRDSTGSYNDNWEVNNYCVDLSTCQAECKDQDQCVGVAWAYAPDDNYDDCGDRSLSRCVVYYSTVAPGSVVEQFSGAPDEYTTYRYLPFVPQTPAPVAPTSAPISPTTSPVAITSAPVAPTSAPVSPTDEPTQPPSRSPTNAPVTPEPTPEPTSEPTPEPTVFDEVDSPTESPTKSCANREGYLWKGNNKFNCEWVGKGNKLKKKRKKCKKRDRNTGKNVAFYCRKTCAQVGVGPCKK